MPALSCSSSRPAQPSGPPVSVSGDQLRLRKMVERGREGRGKDERESEELEEG